MAYVCLSLYEYGVRETMWMNLCDVSSGKRIGLWNKKRSLRFFEEEQDGGGGLAQRYRVGLLVSTRSTTLRRAQLVLR